MYIKLITDDSRHALECVRNAMEDFTDGEYRLRRNDTTNQYSLEGNYTSDAHTDEENEDLLSISNFEQHQLLARVALKAVKEVL